MLPAVLWLTSQFVQAEAADRFPPDDRAIGEREHFRLIKAFGGVYRGDPELHTYINELGQLLAGQSEFGEDEWTFTVLDNPAVNAYALPGGYVYLTRGLLALARNRSDVGAVLAHEIAHVAARHAPLRRARLVAAARRPPVPARTPEELTSPPGAPGLRRHELLARFNHAEELEADALAIGYLRAAGLDPEGVARMLRTSEAHARLTQNHRQPRDHLLSSHPSTLRRLQQASTLEGAATVGGGESSAGGYLDRIDGLLFGDRPDTGRVRGQEVLLGGPQIRFRVPDGFHIRREAGRITAKAVDGTLILYDEIFHRRAVGIGNFLPSGSREIEFLRLDGMDAATGIRYLERRAQRFEIRTLVVHCADDRACRLRYLVPVGFSLARKGDFRQTALSFRRLDAHHRRLFEPRVIQIVTVAPGDTLAALSERMDVEAHPRRWFAVLNGLTADEMPAAGTRVKLVVRGPQ